MAGQSRYTRLHTDAQVQAILKAHLVDGIRPSEIRKMAQAGTLGNQPAFELTTHVYTIIKRGRETFEATNPEALASGTRRELERLHRLALKKARTLAENTDVAEIARVAEALSKSERALNANTRTKPKPPQAAEPNEPANTPQGASVVADLLTKTREGARTGSVARSINDAA